MYGYMPLVKIQITPPAAQPQTRNRDVRVPFSKQDEQQISAFFQNCLDAVYPKMEHCRMNVQSYPNRHDRTIKDIYDKVRSIIEKNKNMQRLTYNRPELGASTPLVSFILCLLIYYLSYSCLSQDVHCMDL